MIFEIHVIMMKSSHPHGNHKIKRITVKTMAQLFIHMSKQTKTKLMKKTAKGMLMILGIAAAATATAQPKYTNDPTYSVHNYKHPNKSAKMKAIQDAQPETYYMEVKPTKGTPDNSLSASSNYKGIKAENSSIKEFRRSEAPEAIPFFQGAPNANYKQQFPARTKKVEIPEDQQNDPSMVAKNTN